MSETAPTLLELSASARHVRDALDAADGGDPEREAELVGALACLEGDIAAKVDACAEIMAELAAEEKALAEYAARWQAKALARGRAHARLRSYVTTCLQAAGVEKVKGARFTAALRTNPPHIDVLDQLLVPEAFWRVKEKREVDKVAIRDAIKAGKTVPGAAMVPGDVRLEVT